MRELIIFAVLPEEIRKEVSLMATEMEGTYWLEPKDHHITLTYIGHVEDESVLTIVEKLSKIDMSSFKTTLKGLGIFSNRVKDLSFLWTGIREVELMRELNLKICAILDENGISHVEREVYNPHMTIAIQRGLDKKAYSCFIEENKEYESREFNMEEFVIYDSKSDDDFNRIYETCGVIKLKNNIESK